MTGEVLKRYTHRGKIVTVMVSEYGYTFCIEDKCNQKKYVSSPYEEYEECEKFSYKLAKKNLEELSSSNGIIMLK